MQIKFYLAAAQPGDQHAPFAAAKRTSQTSKIFDAHVNVASLRIGQDLKANSVKCCARFVCRRRDIQANGLRRRIRRLCRGPLDHLSRGDTQLNTDLMFASKTPEHFTPPWLLDEIEKVAPIGLDPCAHPKAEATKRARCLISRHGISPTYIAKTGKTQVLADGLLVAWQLLLDAHRQYPTEELLVFKNPPYGRELAAWARKAASEKGCAIVALVPARVDTGWWHELNPLIWCALSGRLKFWQVPHSWDDAVREGATGEQLCLNCKVPASEASINCPVAEPVEAENSAPFPSAVCLLHASQLVERFVEMFSAHGICYRRA